VNTCIIRFENLFSPIDHVLCSSSAVAEEWFKRNGFEPHRGPAGVMWVHQGAAVFGKKGKIRHMKGAITARIYDGIQLDQFEFKSA
jgi:hypothetical protein